MTYRPEILPDEYAQGSAFGMGFDTRVVELRNGWEQRVQRHSGRRRYEVNLNIWSTDKLFELYSFFQAVGKGALNSFKFKDWFDYATTEDSVTHNGNATSFDDHAAQSAGGRTVRLTKRYSFGNESHVRFISKLKANTVRMGIGGVEVPSVDWTLDAEAGLVTFGDAFPVGSPTWGGEFYTEVRFEEDTDQLFQIALLGKDTGELPSIGLIENLTDYGWSQDFPAGGGHAVTLPILGQKELNQFLGRVWYVTSVDSSSGVVLPDLFETRPGGPHFLVFNGNASLNINVYDAFQGNIVATIPALQALEIWILINNAGDLAWVFT